MEGNDKSTHDNSIRGSSRSAKDTTKKMNSNDQESKKCTNKTNKKTKDTKVPLTSTERATEFLNDYDNVEHMSDWGFRGTFCHNCGIKNSEISGLLMQCGRCKEAYYCSTKCFNEALPQHQLNCNTNSWTRDPVGTKIIITPPEKTPELDLAKNDWTCESKKTKNKDVTNPKSKTNVTVNGKMKNFKKPNVDKVSDAPKKTTGKTKIPSDSLYNDDTDSDEEAHEETKTSTTKNDASTCSKLKPKSSKTSNNDDDDSNSESSATASSNDDDVIANGDDITAAVVSARKTKSNDDSTASSSENDESHDNEETETEYEEEEEVTTSVSVTKSVSQNNNDNNDTSKNPKKNQKNKFSMNRTPVDGIPEEEDSDSNCVKQQMIEEEGVSDDDEQASSEGNGNDEDDEEDITLVDLGSDDDEDATTITEHSHSKYQTSPLKESSNHDGKGHPQWPTGKQFSKVDVPEKEKMKLRSTGQRESKDYDWEKPDWTQNNNLHTRTELGDNEDENRKGNDDEDEKSLDGIESNDSNNDSVNHDGDNELDEDTKTKGKYERKSKDEAHTGTHSRKLKAGHGSIDSKAAYEKEQIRLRRIEMEQRKEYGWQKPEWTAKTLNTSVSNMSESFGVLNLCDGENSNNDISNGSSKSCLRQTEQQRKKEYKWKKPEWAGRKPPKKTNSMSQSLSCLNFNDSNNNSSMNHGSGDVLYHRSTGYFGDDTDCNGGPGTRATVPDSPSAILLTKNELRQTEVQSNKQYDWEKPDWIRRSPLKTTAKGKVIKTQGDVNLSLSPKALLETGKVTWEKPTWVQTSPLRNKEKNRTIKHLPMFSLESSASSLMVVPDDAGGMKEDDDGKQPEKGIINDTEATTDQERRKKASSSSKLKKKKAKNSDNDKNDTNLVTPTTTKKKKKKKPDISHYDESPKDSSFIEEISDIQQSPIVGDEIIPSLSL